MFSTWVKNVYSSSKLHGISLGNRSTTRMPISKEFVLGVNNHSFVPVLLRSFTWLLSTPFIRFFYLLPVKFYTYSTVPTITNTGLK